MLMLVSCMPPMSTKGMTWSQFCRICSHRGVIGWFCEQAVYCHERYVYTAGRVTDQYQLFLSCCRTGVANMGQSAWQCSFQGGACAPKSPSCLPCRKLLGSCYHWLPAGCKIRPTWYVVLVKIDLHRHMIYLPPTSYAAQTRLLA